MTTTPLGPHLLGRIAPPDSRHLAAFPLGVAAPPQGIEVDIRRPTLSAYDQGQTPECVAYAASKLMNWFNHYAFDAHWLYARCKEVDGKPGLKGTNARAACDVLRRRGHWRIIAGKPVKAGPLKAHGIASNHWALNVDDIRSVFARARPEPVLIGLDWYHAWFKPARRGNERWLQDIASAGGVAGGHEIGIWACSDKRQAFGLANTWGRRWPALVWMPYATMTRLFARGADACVVTDRPTR
jgi:hypothetical protein